MKITEWEDKVKKVYKFDKVYDILKLKKYLTHIDSYAHNFTPEEITEGHFENDDFCAAYVFNENEIAKRSVVVDKNAGWNTAIVFLSTKNKIDIDDIYTHSSGGLTNAELNNFFKVTSLNDNFLIKGKQK